MILNSNSYFLSLYYLKRKITKKVDLNFIEEKSEKLYKTTFLNVVTELFLIYKELVYCIGNILKIYKKNYELLYACKFNFFLEWKKLRK